MSNKMLNTLSNSVNSKQSKLLVFGFYYFSVPSLSKNPTPFTGEYLKFIAAIFLNFICRQQPKPICLFFFSRRYLIIYLIL